MRLYLEFSRRPLNFKRLKKPYKRFKSQNQIDRKIYSANKTQQLAWKILPRTFNTTLRQTNKTKLFAIKPNYIQNEQGNEKY